MAESDTDGEKASDQKSQINFVASPEQKQEWKEYAEEAGFRSLSEFFRVAAQKEVNGSSRESTEPSDVSSEALSEITESLQRVESQMHDLDNRLGTIESEVREDPEIKELASEIFGALPTRDELVEYEKELRKAGARPDPKTPISYTGRLEDIAAHLDEKEHRVEKAIEKLREDMKSQLGTIILNDEIEGWTQEHENGDETRYYKEG